MLGHMRGASGLASQAYILCSWGGGWAGEKTSNQRPVVRTSDHESATTKRFAPSVNPSKGEEDLSKDVVKARKGVRPKLQLCQRVKLPSKGKQKYAKVVVRFEDA